MRWLVGVATAGWWRQARGVALAAHPSQKKRKACRSPGALGKEERGKPWGAGPKTRQAPL